MKMFIRQKNLNIDAPRELPFLALLNWQSA